MGFHGVLFVSAVFTCGVVGIRVLHRRQREHGSGLSFWQTAKYAAVLLGVVRVCALWYVVYTVWAHKESLDDLPLALLLFPEASVLLPAGVPFTVGNVFLASCSYLLSTSALVIATAALLKGASRILRLAVFGR